MREYEQAEALAARALELSEKHHFQHLGSIFLIGLGQARAHLATRLRASH